MNSYLTARAVAYALATSTEPALAPVHIYAHGAEVMPDGSIFTDVPRIELPAVFVRVQFEPLAGSATIGRGKVEVVVETQSDDDTAEQHAQRETAVLAVLADLPALQAAFQAAGGVELLGRPVPTESDPEVQGRAFHTPFTYRIGVRAL